MSLSHLFPVLPWLAKLYKVSSFCFWNGYFLSATVSHSISSSFFCLVSTFHVYDACAHVSGLLVCPLLNKLSAPLSFTTHLWHTYISSISQIPFSRATYLRFRIMCHTVLKSAGCPFLFVCISSTSNVLTFCYFQSFKVERCWKYFLRNVND